MSITDVRPLNGKVALVTGARRGIGRAIATSLAAAGAAVAVTDRDDPCDRVVDEITGNGGKAVGFEIDVRSEAAIHQGVERVVEAFGGIDILVNNAGVIVESLTVDLPTEEWDDHFAVMPRGTFLCSRVAARHMVEQGRGGRIVNIASCNAKRPFEYEVAYAAAKGAILLFSQGLALELGRHQITVNAVCPGAMATDMLTEALDDAARLMGRSGQSLRDEVLSEIPLGRFGTAEDVANVCTFLCSEAAAYVTGAAIDVTGGWTVP